MTRHLLLTCLLFVSGLVSRAETDRPNVVFIAIDDLNDWIGEKQHWGKWTGWEPSPNLHLVIVPSKKQSALVSNAASPCD